MSPWVLDQRHASIWKAFNSVKFSFDGNILNTTAESSGRFETLYAMVHDKLDLFSMGYFQTSLFTWLRGRLVPEERNAKYYIYHDGDLPMGGTILTDGSAIYPERAQNTGEKQRVFAEAITYASKEIKIGRQIDSVRTRKLEAFVKYLMDKRISVILFLPPYHPKTYEMLSQSKSYYLLEIQHEIQALANRLGVAIVGSYNPSDVGFTEEDFFDGDHPNQYAVRRLFSEAMKLPSDNGSPAEQGLEIRVVGVTNPNGLEVVNRKPFFWVGSGSTCLNIRSSQDGRAVLSFTATAGPSLISTAVRRIAITTPAGYSDTVVIAHYPMATMSFPVVKGFNEVCLIPLDTPDRRLTNQKRTLLLGVSDLRIALQSKGGSKTP
jgi:hypothetical protein